VRLSSERAETDMQLVRETIVHNLQETMLESIALHLHADKDIAPKEADVLMDLLRCQYQYFRRKHQLPAR
jgi:hypothetical protein